MLTSQENKKLEKNGSEELGIEVTTPATPQRAVFLHGDTKKVTDSDSMVDEEILFSENNLKSSQQEDALVNNLALYFVSLARKLDQSQQ